MTSQQSTTPSPKVIRCPNCAGTGIFRFPRSAREEGCFVCGGTQTMQGSGKCTEERALAWQKARIARITQLQRTALAPYSPPAELPITPSKPETLADVMAGTAQAEGDALDKSQAS